MPAQERRRRDHEGSPPQAWQHAARSREEDPVDGSDRRTAGCPPKDREFVLQDDDFEFLELLRARAQSCEFESQRSNT